MKSTFGNHFTPREAEVMRLFANGNKSSVVAKMLSLSKRTTDFHKQNAFRKLGVNSMIEAVKALGWLVVPD